MWIYSINIYDQLIILKRISFIFSCKERYSEEKHQEEIVAIQSHLLLLRKKCLLLSATECKLLAKLKFRKAFLCLTLIIDESSTCSIRLCVFALSILSYRSFLYLWQHLRFGGIWCALNENHLTFHNKVKINMKLIPVGAA